MDDLELMSRNECAAVFKDGALHICHPTRVPLYLAKGGGLEIWLKMRAIDEHRTNSRLLKKALRLRHRDDLNTVLHVNAVTITDAYWVRPVGSDLSWSDVRFAANYFDQLALRGDADSFNQPPSRTPELTNIGSFEKCWTLKDGCWWMIKAGNAQERFTELFSSKLAALLGIDAVLYEPYGSYVRSQDFTHGAKVNFESAFSLIGDAVDYIEIYDILNEVSPNLGHAYAAMCFFDAVLFNMDRHEHNFGVLRDVETGHILRMAPLYDHNIALITRGYPKDLSRKNDRLIGDFLELMSARDTGLALHFPHEDEVRAAVQSVPIALTAPENLGCSAHEYVTEFVNAGLRRIHNDLG